MDSLLECLILAFKAGIVILLICLLIHTYHVLTNIDNQFKEAQDIHTFEIPISDLDKNTSNIINRFLNKIDGLKIQPNQLFYMKQHLTKEEKSIINDKNFINFVFNNTSGTEIIVYATIKNNNLSVQLL